LGDAPWVSGQRYDGVYGETSQQALLACTKMVKRFSNELRTGYKSIGTQALKVQGSS